MTRLTIIVLGLGMLASSSALAAERTVTLAVQNMFCADCPFIVGRLNRSTQHEGPAGNT